MYRTTLKSAGTQTSVPLTRQVVIEFVHGWDLDTGYGGKRPGTICKIYLDDPVNRSAKPGLLEDLTVLKTITTLLAGKWVKRFSQKHRAMLRVWIGDQFSRSVGRQIAVGQAAYELGCDHDERKRLQRLVAGTSSRQRRTNRKQVPQC